MQKESLSFLLLGPNYFPDDIGMARYATDLSLYLNKLGHNVEVLTAYSYYPQWKKRKEDRRKLFSTEYHENIKVLRSYIYVPNNPTTLRRTFQEITFFISSLLGSFRAKRPDVILVYTTPITMGFLGVILKWIFRCKLVINVQDFQIEAAEALGLSKKNLAINILEKMELFSYKHSNLVGSVSNGMCNLLNTKKKVPIEKSFYWPNWIIPKQTEGSIVCKGNFRNRYGIKESDIIVGYSGNVGHKQGLETLVDLAVSFNKSNNVVFYLIGDGTGVEKIKKYAITKDVNNIRYLPLLSELEYAEFLKDLDVFFLPQRKTDVEIYFPSKLLVLLEAHILILLAADKNSELYQTVDKNNIGILTSFEDNQKRVEILNQVILSRQIFDGIISNGTFFLSKLKREKVIEDALVKIKEIV